MGQCDQSPAHVSLPPAVESWWLSTGCIEFHQHQSTITLPPPVYSWWEATGSSQFASAATKEVPGLVITGSLDPVPPTAPTGQTTAPTSSPGPSLPGAGAGVGASTPQPTQLTTSKAESNSIPKTSNSEVSLHISTTVGLDSAVTFATTEMEAGSDSTSTVADAASPTRSTPSDAGDHALATPAASSSTTSMSSTPTTAASHPHSGKSARIVAGVVTPLVLLLLLAAALALYRRRRRARDRREWERTHEEIADAVRQVGGTPAAPWSPPRGDVKSPLEGDSAPLFEKSVGTPPG
ncbi:hypothetical protein B0H14DRAFT_1138995 [Mycena olivaceomarginata]|nr:hypothetical protein B0H14DRAFT_1138995 [Mycena olivaceomarginata]